MLRHDLKWAKIQNFTWNKYGIFFKIQQIFPLFFNQSHFLWPKNPRPSFFLNILCNSCNFMKWQSVINHMKYLKPALLAFVCYSLCLGAVSQTPKNYQGLLWEITGNGLSRPSYLFGTMHVSNKLAFHLSDSFYYALKQVDAVALELNPDLWQAQMVRLSELNGNYTKFTQNAGNDFLTENSFQLNSYEDQLKAALSSEPPVVNSLLYRSYKSRDDFEEDTFLDLYIFQAGRKLGKAAAGVEDYYQSEKLVMEAYRDMAVEKKKKDIDLDGESVNSLLQKLQQAYRNGDLDMMDSLDNKMEKSEAFREKFLYRRNEIQADAMDSIIKTRSLFAGVGAAHLPGERGVIELLRKKGYKLRPVKMLDRDAAQKDAINQMKVKVNFSIQHAADGMFSVQVPGPMYALKGNYQQLNRTQYADMSNGAYYLVTRVKTYASFLQLSAAAVIKKTDSLLYEHVPGKIISKKAISKNGYPGYDIVNRTRRGDMQRYNIFITPFEVIIFKMSGKNDYVGGEEGEKFFSSVQLKEIEQVPLYFKPSHGGFGLQLPQLPHQFLKDEEEDRWEYEAIDKKTGDAYLLLKKSVYNYNFLEADSFDLALIETSFRNSVLFEKQISRKPTTVLGYPALEVKEKLSNGATVQAVFIIRGPHYFVLARSSKGNAGKNVDFYKSLKWEPFVYEAPRNYADSFLHVVMQTPVTPELDEGIRTIVEKTAEDAANGNNSSGYMTYWKKVINGTFKNANTGEMVSVQVQEYPRYFYVKDSSKFWQAELDDYLNKKDMLLHEQQSFFDKENSISGIRFSIRDTGSSRSIKRLILLKGKYMFTVSTVTDTLSQNSDFTAAVFKSIQPHPNVLPENLYSNKLSLFYDDLFSKDSALHKRAQQSISNIYFGPKGTVDLFRAINRLSITDKDYFDSKSKLIAELGYIDDSTSNVIPAYLKKIYEQTADTSLFQNEVMTALARLKTKESFRVLKELMLVDPPIFEDNSDYSSFFGHMLDTLQLSARLYPEILQLSALNDYKEHILELLVSLVDSGYVKAADYTGYFPVIFIDAKVAWKKQQGKEEKILEANMRKTEDADDEPEREYTNQAAYSGLNEYAVLLMPFYDSNKNVQQYFSRLLTSSEDIVRMNAAVLLLRNKKPVPERIFQELAAKDKQRGLLFYKLEQAGRLDKFPKQYKNQLQLAKSYLMMQNDYDKMDSVAFLSKNNASIKGKTGQLYFFKYRIKKTDDWKIGISGMQPLVEKELSSNDDLATLTDKKLALNLPLEEQLDRELKKIIFSFYNSSKNFFNTGNEYNNYKYLSEYEKLGF